MLKNINYVTLLLLSSNIFVYACVPPVSNIKPEVSPSISTSEKPQQPSNSPKIVESSTPTETVSPKASPTVIQPSAQPTTITPSIQPSALPTSVSVTISGVTITTNISNTINVGSSLFLSALVTMSNGTSSASNITWTSSDPTIATIDSSGYLSVLKSGSVTITASSGGKTGSVTFTAQQTSVNVPNQTNTYSILMETFAGTYLGNNAKATSAVLANPYGVAIDSKGNMYIADSGKHIIRKVATNGVITTIAGTGVGGYSGDNGPATSAKLYQPTGLAIDSNGNLYIADLSNCLIRKIDTNGIITTVAGTAGVQGYSGDNGQATSAKLGNPYSIAFDSTAFSDYMAKYPQ